MHALSNLLDAPDLKFWSLSDTDWVLALGWAIIKTEYIRLWIGPRIKSYDHFFAFT